MKNKKAPLKPIFVPTSNWDHVHVDLCGPFPTSNSGNKYIIVFVCRRSGAVKATGLKNKQAATTAEALQREIIFSTGPPSIHIHDQGTEFKGEYARVEKEHGIKVIKSSAYHPEGNGKAEAGVKKVKQKLLMFLECESNLDGD